MKRVSPVLTFLAGLVIGGMVLYLLPVHRESAEAILYLAEAQRAPEAVSYSGITLTRCYSPERVESRAEVWHQGPYRQSIKYLSGKLKGYVVGCDGTHNWESDIHNRKVTVTGSRVNEEQASQRFDLLVRNYRVALSGSGTVAGRPAHILTIKPKHPGNPWRQLWLDKKTFVTLRNDEYGPDNRLRSRTLFEGIEYSTSLHNALFAVPTIAGRELKAVPATATRALSIETLEQGYGLTPAQARYIPPGYELERYYLYRGNHMEYGDRAVLTRYVDGLNSISLFAIEVGDENRMLAGSGSSDARQATSVEVMMKGKRYRVFVVGDIAEAELRRVAQSLQ